MHYGWREEVRLAVVSDVVLALKQHLTFPLREVDDHVPPAETQIGIVRNRSPQRDTCLFDQITRDLSLGRGIRDVDGLTSCVRRMSGSHSNSQHDWYAANIEFSHKP